LSKTKTVETFNCPLCREDTPRTESVKIDQWRICKTCASKLKSKKASKPTKEKLSKTQTINEEVKQTKKVSKKLRKKLKKQAGRTVIYVVGDTKKVLASAKKIRTKIDKVEKRKDRTKARIEKLQAKVQIAEDRLVKYTERQVKYAERITDAEFMEQEKVKALKVEKLGKTLDGGLRFYKKNAWHVVPPSLIGSTDAVKGSFKAEDKKLVAISGEVKEKKLSRKIARKIEEQ